jgi:hypothetical protein
LLNAADDFPEVILLLALDVTAAARFVSLRIRILRQVPKIVCSSGPVEDIVIDLDNEGLLLRRKALTATTSSLAAATPLLDLTTRGALR